jgi:2-(1,2-epoxy-1,2-dihydrophenyl)acetyl-CoA isomerase
VSTEPHVRIGDTIGHVTDVVLCRPPNNFFSSSMIAELASALELLDSRPETRVILLSAEGKHFCAGADFARTTAADETELLYAAAVRLFRTAKPLVACVHGAAIGGGLGVAMAADFRVTCPEARFSANFARLGFHHGFGLTETLPRAVGRQRAAELLLTGRRIDGREATDIGLADRCVSSEKLSESARAFAAEIALSAPLAVESIRATLRGDLADRVARAVNHERLEQERLRTTKDFVEGVRATAERRPPNFTRT